MKSIAWAILLAGIFISTSLDTMARPDRVYTNGEGAITSLVFVGFLLSLILT